MIFFPLKWLPWIMLIGGIFATFTEEGNVWSVLVAIAGGVWICFQHSGNKNKPTSSTPKSIQTTKAEIVASKPSVVASEKKEETPKIDTCARCGNILLPNAKFCDKCGLNRPIPLDAISTKKDEAPKTNTCSCGNSLASNAVFCDKCGKRVQ